MDESTRDTKKQQSINDLSSSVLQQIHQFTGDALVDMDYSIIRQAGIQLSHLSEKIKMIAGHVFSYLQDSLDNIHQIPKVAPEAFIWMEFKECLVKSTDKYAFHLAEVPVNQRVCCYCHEQCPFKHPEENQLHACKYALRASGIVSGPPRSCPNYFHLSCLNTKKAKSKAITGRFRNDPRNDLCCLDCSEQFKKTMDNRTFRGAKLVQAAHVHFPTVLNFCEFHASVAPDSSGDYIVQGVKPGLFPFLSFGSHHAHGDSKTWHQHYKPKHSQFWIEPIKQNPASSDCVQLLKHDLETGVLYKFSGQIRTQVQRCARVGVISPASLRKCGVADPVATKAAQELMQTMRESEMGRVTEPAKLKLICAKKVESWTLALARDNGDVVVSTCVAPLSGPPPDQVKIVKTHTLTVCRDDAEPRVAAERVAWNCDGTVLAASCQDCRVVLWEKSSDIDKHPQDPADAAAAITRRKSTCENLFHDPIVSLSWSPVQPHVLLVATVCSCFVMKFKPSTIHPVSCAGISIERAHEALPGITCAVFGSNGSHIAVGTRSSGWCDIGMDSSDPEESSRFNLPHGSGTATVSSICALPIARADSSSSTASTHGRDFAVASLVASVSIVHIWKFSEFRRKYEVVKEFRLPSSAESSSTVTSLLCSRDNQKEADSFKILALNGSDTGYIINYLGNYCYASALEPVKFWWPSEQNPEKLFLPVKVTRAAWGAMARTIAFCDFSNSLSSTRMKAGPVWPGLPSLYELWRRPVAKVEHPVSNRWVGEQRLRFGVAATCDLSVHTVVEEVKTVDDEEEEGGGEDLRVVESIWNPDVMLHQQVVSRLADHWKKLARKSAIPPATVEKVVKHIAVMMPAIAHLCCRCFRARVSYWF